MGPFLLKRGSKGHAHLTRYNPRGEFAGAFCGIRTDAGWISSNVPWGRAQCKHCLRKYRLSA